MKKKPVIEYTAPQDQQKWQARDVVDVHWHLFGFKCPPSVNRVLSAIISHANVKDGQCNPSWDTLRRETGYGKQTVSDAMAFAKEEGFITTERPDRVRGNSYHVNWGFFSFLHNWAWAMSLLGMTWRDVVHPPFKEVHTSDTSEVHTSPTSEVHTSPTSEVHTMRTSYKNLKEEPLKVTSNKKEEGASPPGLQGRIIFTAFEKKWLSPVGIEAAKAADLETLGSGRAVAAKLANEAWKKSRNIKGKAKQ